MGRYIIRRLLWVIVLLIVISLVTFMIFYLLPSADPAVLRAGRSPNPALLALFLFANDIGKVKIFDGANTYTGLTANPGQWFGSLIMPWFVLAASFAAFYARLLRSNLIETMSEDYIRTARAKGLSERRVILRHGVRSAITPIVTVLGLDIGILMGGAILTETVFNIPGVGRLAYEGIINADLPVIQGTVLFGAFFIVIANLVVDIGYAFIDPRIRYT